MARHDPTSSSDSETSEDRSNRRRRDRHRSDRRSKGDSGGDKDGKSRREKKKKSRRDERKEERRRERRRQERRRNRRRSSSESDSSSSGNNENLPRLERVVGNILEKFPNTVNELIQLMQMIDKGQAVDTRGISDKYLLKYLKKLFLLLRLNENGHGVFLLPSAARPTLERIGPLICLPTINSNHQNSPNEPKSIALNVDDNEGTDAPHEKLVVEPNALENPSTSGRRRIIGPEMPSSELLAAAAKLTEAESELRDAELDVENDLFIGPPPPALVAEAASANEAERFEEVSRIMGAETDSPYDVLGVNHNTSTDNIKKRYWKLSLLVHPDKCSHPQAHQAFIHLNKAFKELQDPEKKKIADDKIRMKEEQEAFKVELRALREAAQWRRSQGISMEGDDELLAEPEQPQKREEWMTTLPPERRPGMSMHSTTSFSRTGKEGRGDTSAWTDNPLDKAQKAKMNYLEAYNKANELAAEEDKKQTSTDAHLVDQYNKSKRSVPLVQKVQEEANSRRKKKKVKVEREKEEWVGEHPWKPWDRERDLVAGRQKVNFDSNSMADGLASRFASGTIQRNFL